MRKEIEIKRPWEFQDEERKKIKHSGWYRITSLDGLQWNFYKDGDFDVTVVGSENEDGTYNVWVGDANNNVDDIDFNLDWDEAENTAIDWINEHPTGEYYF